MKCPACGRTLQQIKAGNITVDVCKGGCGGIWFDQFELEKVGEPHEAAGESLLDIQRDESIVVDYAGKRMCPKCEGIVMMRHFFSVEKQVEVDECPSCAGYWLDYGELGKIRSRFASEQERKKAADEYFSEVFDKRLTEMAAESKGISKIARVFRFFSLSYYLRGK
jgi:Zn-finger nucleic acid-binding protein